MMKRHLIIRILLVFLYLPLVFSFLRAGTGLPFDVPLDGFTDANKEVQFSFKDYCNGNFQKSYTASLDASHPLKGVLTRTYSTLNYHLFKTGSGVIGKNDDIFEENYIKSELAIGEKYDYSTPEKQEEMKCFVEKLELLQKKLERFDKKLYVYITPSKANFCREDIPDRYLAVAPRQQVNPADTFRKYMSDTDIPCLYVRDMKDALEYPAFYPTGIHWSRTFEQLVTLRVIRDLGALTGKDYRTFGIGQAEHSREPFDRDADVYELLNLWEKPDHDYYKYKLIPIFPDEIDKMRVLMYGDSFGQGIRKDFIELSYMETLYYVNYKNYILDLKGRFTELHKDFANLDWKYYLDSSDIIVIQMGECLIKDYTLGFVDYMNDYLETYSPDTAASETMTYLAPGTDSEWNQEAMEGFYDRESGHVWMSPSARLYLDQKALSEEGLEIRYTVPNELFSTMDKMKVHIYVNGKKIQVQEYSAPQDEVLYIRDLPETENNVCELTFLCSGAYCPSELGISKDSRKLALKMTYVGKIR